MHQDLTGGDAALAEDLLHDALHRGDVLFSAGVLHERDGNDDAETDTDAGFQLLKAEALQTEGEGIRQAKPVGRRRRSCRRDDAVDSSVLRDFGEIGHRAHVCPICQIAAGTSRRLCYLPPSHVRPSSVMVSPLYKFTIISN